MKVKFEGGEAEKHRLELYQGTESLNGIGRAAVLVGHYIATGQVRFRAPYSNQVQFYIVGTKAGSFDVLIDLISRAAKKFKEGSKGELSDPDAAKLLHRVIERATGSAKADKLKLDGQIIPEGDIDALAEAATPGLQRAHRWIDNSTKKITVSDKSGLSAELDSDTKAYLESEEVDAKEDVQDVSVGALNVNSRNGRVYFSDLGRTVPFWVPRDATARTIPTLSRYLTQYAERTGATVNIRFKRVRYPDLRLKRIIISDCYAIKDAR